MPFDIEHEFEELKKVLNVLDNDVRKVAESALAEAKKTGEVQAETKAKADELLTKQGVITDAVNTLENKIEGLETRNLELEQALANRQDGPEGGPRQSLGRAVIENEAVKNHIEAGGRGKVSITVENAITSAAGSAGPLIEEDRQSGIIGLPRQQLRIRNLLMPGRTTSNMIEYLRQLARTNNAAPVAETLQKPESDYTWELVNTPVRTIAHWIHVSRQALDDASQLESEINGELRYGLDLVEDAQLLSGDGIGENISGLTTNSTPYDGTREPAGATMIDKLRIAFLEASLDLYPADAVVMNDADWALIELQKDAENRYIFANPQGIATPIIWGRNVVPTLAIAEDTFLAGAFRMAAQIFDRMDTEVLMSDEDRDNFIKNMITIRAEKRLALAVKRSQALRLGDFGRLP